MTPLPPGIRELRRRVHMLADLVDELGAQRWSATVTLLREIAERAERVARLASDLATEITNTAGENGCPTGDTG